MIINNKSYNEDSVFKPENLLREARRQKSIRHGTVPKVCVLDPDGDVLSYLQKTEQVKSTDHWACYHTIMYVFNYNDIEVGIIGNAVGASFAVLLAEQMFVSGCELLISITSAGIINQPKNESEFILITKALRDEGTSYHYMPPSEFSELSSEAVELLKSLVKNKKISVENGTSWTTDAPYRETNSAIQIAKSMHINVVEMEAAALYAFAQAKNKRVVCFAHLTNTMAQDEGDFEKGEENGSIKALELIYAAAASLSNNLNSVKKSGII